MSCCSFLHIFCVFSVCKLHRYNVEKCGAIEKRGGVCTLCSNGDPYSVSSYTRAQHFGVMEIFHFQTLSIKQYLCTNPEVLHWLFLSRRRTGQEANRTALRPPSFRTSSSIRYSPYSNSSSGSQRNTSFYPDQYETSSSTTSSSTSLYNNKVRILHTNLG